MSTMFWIWMAAALVFLIIELLSPAFVFACFVAGAVTAGVYAQFSPDAYYWQIGIFVIVTVVLLPLTRGLARRITRPSPTESNVDRLLGQTALVTKAISPDSSGQVRFEGEIWVAQSEIAIPAEARVRILKVVGTHLHVEPANTSDAGA